MLNFFSTLFDSVVSFISTIKEVIFTSVDVINIAFSFIPSPFREITLTFLTITVGIIIYKVVRS